MSPETPQKPLRLWPGVALVVLQVLLRYGLLIVAPEQLPIALFGGMGCVGLTLLWWLFFSRAAWVERLGALVLIAAALYTTSRFIDPSLATGAMGFLFWVLAVPPLGPVLVLWAVATQALPTNVRRATMAASLLLTCGVWAGVRTGGFSGTMKNDLHWRWTPTPEQRLIAAEPPAALPVAPKTVPVAAVETPAPVAAAAVSATPVPTPVLTPTVAKTPAEWPGFRGARRDGIVTGGVRIATDWSASPPVQMWTRAVGPGWSSFAVHGDRIYTQEQRGEDEVVACYNVKTGKPVWAHLDATRFWESNAGAGPRGTPTLSGDRVYALGATGILNTLDEASGAVIWSRNVATDTGVKIPGWGFTSSPLVIDDLVVVAARGKLAAYDLATGKPRWTGPDGGDGYSSPELLTISGVAQVVLLSADGAISVAPGDGAVLWEYKWHTGTRIVQPAVASESDFLMLTGESMGGGNLRRVGVTRGGTGWSAAERWTSTGLKPSFNDLVVHDGYVYGFDGIILGCVDLKDGKRQWKGGRYGNGQLILLADQGLLLVLSEDGDLALVQASPTEFKELGHVPAIEGKTWNHPVLAGDVLLVRNGEEMAAFRLAREK